MAEFLNPDGSVWVPEFEGQRPPFQKGNRLSVGNRGPLKAGHKSARVYGPLAKAIRAELKRTDGLEYLADGSFADALYAYSIAEAQMRLYAEWVDTQPMEVVMSDAEGTPPWEVLRQLEVRAGNLGKLLGLHPRVSPEVSEQIRVARTRIEAQKQRKAQRDAEQAAMRDAMREAVQNGHGAFKGWVVGGFFGGKGER